MKKKFKIIITSYVVMQSVLVVLFLLTYNHSDRTTVPLPAQQIPTLSPSPVPKTTLQAPAPVKILENNYHIFQTFNNCGPAALSMALSYYGINETQQALGEALRPFQNPKGDNDDKSVTLEELAEKSKDYGFIPYHRPNGNSELIKLFITYDIPIITRTLLKTNDDIGHYRVVKGYDDTAKEFVQDDSLQGKNLKYSYEDFDAIWKKFNFEYLVLVPKDKKEVAERILGENADFKKAWENSANTSQKKLNNNPNDIDARFNLSVALYNVGNFKQSTEEFEKIENSLPFRTLWYQIEPIKAYYELGNYDRVFLITDKILDNHNRAFSELYILRGKIYQKQGNIDLARAEFEKAVLYNKNLQEAHSNLNSLSSGEIQ